VGADWIVRAQRAYLQSMGVVISKTKMSCMEMTSVSMPVTSEIVITLRIPSDRRDTCTTAWIADAIWRRTARSRMHQMVIETMFSIRESASR
jgi:hypothetical protein